MKWRSYIEIILFVLLKCGKGQLRRKYERQRLKGATRGTVLRNDIIEQPNSTITLLISSPSDVALGSQIRRRCYNYLACESFIPAVDISNPIVESGRVVLRSLALEDPIITHMNQFYVAKTGHLSSSLVTLGENNYDFIAGPQLEYRLNSSIAKTCSNRYRAISASFLFPWESHNAYHSMNDNLFSVLANQYLQRYLHPELAHLPTYTYHFNRLSGKTATTMYKLIEAIVGENQFQPAKSLFKNGAQCIEHLMWGMAYKVFYKDSFFNLRSELYDTLRKQILSLATPPINTVQKIMPKVVVITRGSKGSSGSSSSSSGSSNARRLTQETETKIIQLFQSLGVSDASICCDFTKIHTPQHFINAFADVDICIGIHGAGLSNCILGNPGMIMVELQTHHNFGFDSFMKISHMMKGQYLMFDIRNAAVLSTGTTLPPDTLKIIVQNALALWKFSQRKLPFQFNKMQLSNMTKPDSNLVHTYRRLYRPDTTKIFAYRPPYTGQQIARQVYAKELIIDWQQKTYYSSSSDPIVQEFITQDLQVKHLQHRDLQTHPGEMHVVNALQRLDNPGPASNYEQRSVKKVNNAQLLNNIDGGKLYIAPADHLELWIIFNPALYDDFEQTSVLGPLMEDGYLHCIHLPYFKFRLLTMPWREHRGECDRHLIQRKRSGANDEMLMKRLID